MTFTKKHRLDRRTLLRGTVGGGAFAVGLPLLEAMLNGNGDALAQGAPLPRRFVSWFFGNGVNLDLFEPDAPGTASWTPSFLLQDVADVKDYQRIRQLPLNGRAVSQLFNLTPGVEGGGNARVNGLKVGSLEIIDVASPHVQFEHAHLNQVNHVGQLLHVHVRRDLVLLADRYARKRGAHGLAGVLLKETVAGSPVRTPQECERPIRQCRQQPRLDGFVVARELQLRNAAFRPQHAIGMRQLHAGDDRRSIARIAIDAGLLRCRACTVRSAVRRGP